MVVVESTGQSDTTDSTGTYLIENVPAGDQILTASASGYISQTKPTTVPDGGTVVENFALSPVGDEMRVVLQWGADPADLDLHMSGPDGGDPPGRFHVAWFNRTHDDYVSLDRDDVDGFGPETTTVTLSTSRGQWVAGDYHVWIHNWTNRDGGGPGFDVSDATVTFFALGAQQAQYSVNDATGDPDDPIWLVFRFTIDASGNLVGAPVVQQSFTTGSHLDVF